MTSGEQTTQTKEYAWSKPTPFTARRIYFKKLWHISHKDQKYLWQIQKSWHVCCKLLEKKKMNENIEEYFNIAHESTKETRLILLHFKFIHSIYPTNILLNKMGLATTKQSTERNDIEHAFYQCTKLENHWRNAKQYILINYDWRLEINENVFLFGVSNTEIEDAEIRKKVYHIILIAKLAISKYKYGKCKNFALIFEVELKMRSHKI